MKKAAVVMGGGSGIGRGIALALAKDGVDVAVADIDASHAGAVAQECAAYGVKTSAHGCDVTDADAVEALADTVWTGFGRVDQVYNNAGVIAMGPGLDFTTQDLSWLFEVNVYGTWYGCAAFGRRFLEQHHQGWICNTASENAIGMSSVGSAIYTGTKHAVLGFTDVLRHEYSGRIGFSVLCPGAVNTSIWDSGRNRQARFEGSAVSMELAHRAMRYGLDPHNVGRLAVDGVNNGEFLIITHPHEREVAERRWQDVANAIKRQWPNGPDARHFSSAEIQARCCRR